MEKYCTSCGRVLGDVDFKLCPYCGNQLREREGRQSIPRELRHKVFAREKLIILSQYQKVEQTILTIYKHYVKNVIELNIQMNGLGAYLLKNF